LNLLGRLLPSGFWLRKEDPITTSHSEPEPDISIVRGDAEDYAKAHPATAELAIEVSVSSEEIDFRKAAIYAEAGVKECWVVEPLTKKVTVFRSPNGRAYDQTAAHDGAQAVTSVALPTLRVTLPELFA
jgi:Uma2 family endonuclease